MASYYGKRPLWQWVLIYLIVGGILYYLIYHFVFAPKGGYSSSGGYNYNNSKQSSPSGY